MNKQTPFVCLVLALLLRLLSDRLRIANPNANFHPAHNDANSAYGYTGATNFYADSTNSNTGATNANARTAHRHTNQSAAYRDGSAIAHTAPFYSCRSTQIGSATRRTSAAN